MSATYEGLALAMMGTTDGGMIDQSSDIPIGEAFRLAVEYLGLRPDATKDVAPQYVRSRCTTCDEVIEGDRYAATLFHPEQIDWQPHECPPSDEEQALAAGAWAHVCKRSTVQEGEQGSD